MKLNFKATNNIDEYEARIGALEVTFKMGIKKIKINNDSIMIIYKISNGKPRMRISPLP